jgi:predicted flap endonuclease-1-like 5' DNA nuclease
MGAALREAWLWVLLAFLLGLTIGYFVRQQPVRVRAMTSRTSTGTPTAPRIAAFEALHEAPVGDHGLAASVPTTAKATDASISALASSADSVAPMIAAERAPAAIMVATAPSAQRAVTGTLVAAMRAATKPARSRTRATNRPAKRAPVLDLAIAKATLGVTVKLDDLKLIEGIGPKIETLFNADGITSWHELSKANVERLQGVLDAAGPRYKFHDPASWPRQAGLLANGKWAEFKTLTDKLKDGR